MFFKYLRSAIADAFAMLLTAVGVQVVQFHLSETPIVFPLLFFMHMEDQQ